MVPALNCGQGANSVAQAPGMNPVEPAPELTALLNRPANSAFREFYAYWRGKAGAKSMPARGDLDPLDNSRLPPGLFLVDVLPGGPHRFHFRLVGMRIAEPECEITNKFPDGPIPDSALIAMARQYEDATEGRVYVRRETLRWYPRERARITYDVLLLPLSREEATVDMLFGSCAYDVH